MQFVPSKTFNDKELKRLLKGCLLTTVVDTGLGASKKVVDTGLGASKKAGRRERR